MTKAEETKSQVVFPESTAGMLPWANAELVPTNKIDSIAKMVLIIFNSPLEEGIYRMGVLRNCDGCCARIKINAAQLYYL